MADKKISELTNITGANLADTDEFVVVDTSASETKAITWAELKEGLDTGTGFVRITGDTMTGNLSFGDNDKAIFGAGSDLQIYHSGAHSIINENGTGDLLVQANTFKLQNAAGTATALDYDPATGALQLYKSNAIKLATTSTGVDVTGTVTADGLTVASASSGVNTTLGSNAVGLDFSVGHTGNGTGTINLYPKSSPSTEADSLSLQLGGTTFFKMEDGGDISFYEDTGTTPKFFWDASAERLGLGTSSPIGILETYNTSSAAMVSTTTTGYSGFRARSTSGNFYYFIDDSTGSAFGAGAYSRVLWSDGAYPMVFGTNATERMRIDSSGNLLVGTTSTNPTTGTSEGIVLGAGGIMLASNTSDAAIALNRTTTDGDIAIFKKNGTPVGSIASKDGDLAIGTGAIGIRFLDGSSAIVPQNHSTNSGTDGLLDLGVGAARFKDLYLSGGVYLGGTVAANKLEDYEVGSYDPTITPSDSGSVTIDSSYNTLLYERVGDIVHVHGAIDISATSSPTGYFTISLPFQSSSTDGQASRSSGSILVYNNSSANISEFITLLLQGNANVRVYLGDGTTLQGDSAQQLTSATVITLSLTYRAV